ncbi:MAG: hypothetical protein ABJH05_11100 [Fulvivirga sp.]
MNADITYQPESGNSEEVYFEEPSVWNSQTWTWVKFEDSEFQDWFGSFRGEPFGHLAFSEISGHAIIPTSDATYIVDINKRELLKLIDSKYQIGHVTLAPDGQTFILASFCELFRTSINYDLIEIQNQLDIDFVEFGSKTEDAVEFEYEEIGVWNRQKAKIDTKNWGIELRSTI